MEQRKSRYERVMPRVFSKTRVNSKPSFTVTRHDTSSRVGGKTSVSNVSSGAFSDLPVVLDDYEPEANEVPKRTLVRKPKRTLESLEPVKPPVSVPKIREIGGKSRSRAPDSAPAVRRDAGGWSEAHFRQCFSTRSHSKLQELKDEIKAYKEKEDLLRLRSRLYKQCGVVLDDAGRVAEDKAVQAVGFDFLKILLLD